MGDPPPQGYEQYEQYPHDQYYPPGAPPPPASLAALEAVDDFLQHDYELACALGMRSSMNEQVPVEDVGGNVNDNGMYLFIYFVLLSVLFVVQSNENIIILPTFIILL